MFIPSRINMLRTVALLTGCVVFNHAAGADSSCSSDLQQLDRGERTLLRICGNSLTAESTLTGLKTADIDLLYRQDLRRCAPQDKRPGLFLEIQAGAAARTTQLKIDNLDTTQIDCQIGLIIPERRLLPPAMLSELTTPGHYRLTIANVNDIDLSSVCNDNSNITFPSGPGPEITLIEPSPVCSEDELNISVAIETGPRQPAKMIVNARDHSGNVISAVTHVNAPEPGFVSAMTEADARYVSVNGIRTRYFDKGEGEILVLVHGGQPSAPDFNAWEWQQNFDGLAQQFRVIAVDRIGQGGTANPANLDDYENYYSLVAEHLLGFLQALKLDQVHLVGHSQGGWPVTRITLNHPELVKSLLIVDSTMIAKASDPTKAIRFYIYQQNELHPAAGPTVQSIRRGLEFFSHTNNNITQQRIYRILATSQTEKFAQASDWFNQSSMSPAHPSYRKLKAGIWDELLAGKLVTPTLIIWGEEDPEGSFPAGVAMAETLQEAGSPVSFHPFPNAGHVAYMEYPDEFNRVVTQFIQTH
jgi:2-hydroxy-6-oxonona-2,4-dienedioate hydrolase